jgi:hypothetical protein
MAYTLNSVDFTTYGITPGQIAGGNIALAGCFDFPPRIGDTHHEWGDEDGYEIYTDADELFYAGRDITFDGHLTGTRTAINANLNSLFSAFSAASGTQVFATPYGTFNVYAKDSKITNFREAARIKLVMREPVVTITGGTIPGGAASGFQIDGIPMSAFGLYPGEIKSINEYPEMKTQYFTKSEAEGFHIAKRKAKKFEFKALMMAATLATFITNVRNLYALYASIGLRTFTYGSNTITGAPLEGFTITNVVVGAQWTTATLKSNISVTAMT